MTSRPDEKHPGNEEQARAPFDHNVFDILIVPFVLLWSAVASLIGLILGPVIGAVAGEAIRSRRLDASLKSGIGTVVGMVLGTLAKFCLALVMVALFLWWVVGAS